MPAVLAEGLDYSAGRPRGSALAARGIRFVVRYIDRPDRMAGKHITPAEYADLVAHGIDVWLVAERNTTDWQGGRAGGAALARDARAGADHVGYPPGRLIFLTADMHLSASQIPTVLAFIDGAASVLGWAATGGYGFSELIRALKAGNHCRGLWQTGSRSVLVPGVHIYQANDRPNVVVDGVACDVNELLIPLEDDDVTPEEHDWLATTRKLVADVNHQTANVLPAWRAEVNTRLNTIDAKLEALALGGGTVDPAALGAELAKHLRLEAI